MLAQKILNVMTKIGFIIKDKKNEEKGFDYASLANIIIKARVKPHPIFARDGNDLYVSVIIPEELAKTGGEINVHTLKGIIPYYIPANTKTGAIFTMHGHGIKKDNTKTAGDLKITVTVQER